MVVSNGNENYPVIKDISSPFAISEYSLSDQIITFGNCKEISVGMMFPVQLNNQTLGRGYYKLDQKQEKNRGKFHQPVLVSEVVKYLVTCKCGIYLDCTIGGGGHSEEILKRVSSSAKLLGMDLDDQALEYSNQRLEKWKNQIILENSNFKNLDLFLNKLKIQHVDGILMDLGVSSHQIDSDYRGFSFMHDGPLDMRMDRNQQFGAFQIVNSYTELELRRIIREFGEERRANSIAREIVKSRMKKKIDSTSALMKIVSSVVNPKDLNKSLARIFQSLRIEVNSELKNLQTGLKLAVDFLKPGGRLVVLAYHSLEDRIAKQFFKEQEKGCICPPEFPKCVCGQKGKLKILTKRPITPSEKELKMNIRSRSVKMRVAERV